MVLAVLAVVWVVVIGSYLKEKAAVHTGDSVSAFQDQLSTLQRTNPGGRTYGSRPVSGPQGAQARALSNAARRRRRDVLFTVAGLAAFTFLIAIVTRTVGFVVLNVFFDLAAAGYVLLLVNQQRIVREQRAKVRHLHRAPRPVHYGVTAVAAGRR